VVRGKIPCPPTEEEDRTASASYIKLGKPYQTGAEEKKGVPREKKAQGISSVLNREVVRLKFLREP